MNSRKKSSAHRLIMVTAGLMVSACLALSTSPAMAHGRVDWSIGIGLGGPPVVYQQPEVVYAQPPVVYTEPPAVVYEQAPIVQYRDPYYWHRRHEWRERERREHEWREHEWHERHGW